MNIKNKTFIFYTEWKVYLELLSPEEIKNLIFIIINYVEKKEEPKKPNLSDRLLLVWVGLKSKIDGDKLKYDKRCETSRENGKKGGRPKKSENLKNLKKPKKADNDNDDDSDNDNDITIFNKLNIDDDASNNSAPATTDIFKNLENSFGYTIPTPVYQKIQKWKKVFDDDVINYAIDICCINNVRTFAYLEGILKSWYGKGYKKLIDCKNERNNSKNEPLPEWFDKNLKKREATKEEQLEMEILLKEFKDEGGLSNERDSSY